VQRILVVDDSKAWRDEACEIIESQPAFQVIAQAEDGEQAVRLATTLKPDLVVLDIGLPKLNGLAAAARIFEASRGIKIVFLSQDGAPDIVQAARNIGASGFVCKPKAATNLLRAIALAIGAQRREEFYLCPLCRLPAYT
jgi:DNA-binding NarL/FixJ family response regulator